MKYLDENNIGSKGCSQLSRAHWPSLQFINLSKEDIESAGDNKIGAKGCSNLSKVHWPNLQTIGLSKEDHIHSG